MNMPGLNFQLGEDIDALRDAVVLGLLIIFLFLQDWKATMVPALALPIALLGAMVFVKAFGFSINELTLLGVILATGLVVDDAIVVSEDIGRRLEQGASPLTAARDAMAELGGAVVATSLVLVVVFIPVLGMQGSVGRLYAPIAITISATIIPTTKTTTTTTNTTLTNNTTCITIGRFGCGAAACGYGRTR